MSKPDWRFAPPGFEWLAQDSSGDWYWYMTEPAAQLDRGIWLESVGHGHGQLAAENFDLHKNGWSMSLERRP